MAYPKKAKKENVNDESMVTAPVAPTVAPTTAPQVIKASGGAPKVSPNRAVQSSQALGQAWKMTGATQGMTNRTFQRTQLGVEPAVVASSLRQFWEGQAATGTPRPLPTPPTMTLEQAQKYLGDLTANVKTELDQKLATLPADQRNSRFWRAYQAYPAEMASLTARHLWTSQIVGTGPVADWMNWLKG